jgi:hypothetical protein
MMVMLPRSFMASVPEPEATANTIVLGAHETTGFLPVGFEFECGGWRFNRFDLSTDGFVRFGGDFASAEVDSRLPLGPNRHPRLGGGLMAYEVRGAAPRRRLVVSFSDLGLERDTLQLVVHERTGIIEVRPERFTD